MAEESSKPRDKPLGLEDLPEEARGLSPEEAEKLTGGLVTRGGIGGAGPRLGVDTWTWTDPTEDGGLKTKDDD